MEKKQTYFYGTGRRKTAVARVRLLPGKGAIIINGKPLEEHYPHLEQRRAVLQSLLVTDTLSKYNAIININKNVIFRESENIFLTYLAISCKFILFPLFIRIKIPSKRIIGNNNVKKFKGIKINKI